MIGFNYLGKLGQLGNQMFQYASLRGIAKNRGYDFRIPYHEEVFVDSLGNRLRIELFTPFVMSNVTADKVGMIGTNNLHDSQSIDSTVPEPHFNFSEDLFNNCPDNITLHGYYQSEKYFKNVEDEIQQDFTFKPEIALNCKHTMSTVDTPIALHIRRGDYLKNSDQHTNLGLDYYEAAL